MKKIFIFLSIAAIMGFSSCASIFEGTHDYVNFVSIPHDAEIWVDGIYRGNTPLLNLKLKADQDHLIEIRKNGFVTQQGVITSSIAVGYIVVDVLLGVIPVIIDASTGAWVTLDETEIYTRLTPIAPAAETTD